MTTEPSDTPLTDAQHANQKPGFGGSVPLSFARDLERKLAAANEQIENQAKMILRVQESAGSERYALEKEREIQFLNEKLKDALSALSKSEALVKELSEWVNLIIGTVEGGGRVITVQDIHLEGMKLTIARTQTTSL